MALFKTFRGKRENLDTVALTDGYAYFCTDDGSFWIDYLDGGEVKRKQVNDEDLKKLNLNLENGEGLDSIVQKYSGDVDATHYGNTSTGESAAVFGEANNNTANRALLAGKLNTNSGANAIVGGLQNTNKGNHSITVGTDNNVQNTSSVTAGIRNTITVGNRNIVAGYDNELSTVGDSVVVGNNNDLSSVGGIVATGANNNIKPKTGGNCDYMLVGGENHTITDAKRSIVAGNINTIASWNTVTTGMNNTVNHSNTIVSGFQNQTSKQNQAVFGEYNEYTSDDAKKALFIIGNGNQKKRNNAFEVLADGRAKIYGTPTENNDVVTKSWVEGKLAGKASYLGSVANAVELKDKRRGAAIGDYCIANSKFDLWFLSSTSSQFDTFETVHVGDLLFVKSTEINDRFNEDHSDAWDVIHTEDPSKLDNYVTTDTDQEISGGKTFINGFLVGKTENEEFSLVQPEGIFVVKMDNGYGGGTSYVAQKIVQHSGGNEYEIAIPDKTGTIALLEDINIQNGEGTDSIVQKYTAQEDDVEGEDFANTATGPNTVTFGKSNTNSGKRSVVTGKLNDNTGANNIIGGLLNEASGNSCIIGGQNNQSSARDTLVVGSENRNLGPNSAITGFNNENNGESNLIAGRDNTNYFSNQNLIVGSNNWADQDAAHPAGNSIIGGENNHVFGLDTIVGGSNNTANSKHNLIVGFGNKVTQNDNATFGNHIVSGEQNEVTGLDNTVNGFDNTVSGDYNTVGGYQHTVSGGKNAVSGHNNTVLSSNSVVGGAGVTVNASSVGALAVASGGSVKGTGSWIGGQGCEVNQRLSFAHGEYLKSDYARQVVFGRYNDNKSNTLFEIGYGTGENVTDESGNITTKNRKNVFEVCTDGYVKVSNLASISENSPLYFESTVSFQSSVEFVDPIVIQDPEEEAHAVNKRYVDGLIGDIDTILDSILAMQNTLIGGNV